MGEFVQELVRFGIYKRSQGRVTRQVTAAALALVFVAAMVSFYRVLKPEQWAVDLLQMQYWAPALLLAFGLWFSYRMVNVPAVADFLISVEAEMMKVSWPTRRELVRASVVVLVLLFSLAAVLYAFDAIWFGLFKTLGIYG